MGRALPSLRGIISTGTDATDNLAASVTQIIHVRKGGPQARLRAAFAVVSDNSEKVRTGQLGDLLERLGHRRDSAPKVLEELQRDSGVSEWVSYEVFAKWWEREGVDDASWIGRARQFGITDLGIMSTRDNNVDEYDGLKIIARNRVFSLSTLMLCIISIAAAIFNEYQDLYNEEIIIGCSGADVAQSNNITIDNCQRAGFGKPGCYETWRVRKTGGGVLGDALLFSLFSAMMFTLVLVRYILWRDQALVFELLQYQVLVSVRRGRYVCWLILLAAEVVGYGAVKLWVTEQHEKNELIEDGVADSCSFVPKHIRLESHADNYTDMMYRVIIFGLVLQAPVRDIALAATNLYYQVSLKDVLRCGHPRPGRLLEGFRLARLVDVQKYLGARRYLPFLKTRPLEDFVEEYEGRFRPVDSGRRETWESIMAQAYKMAGLQPAAPGSECTHPVSCFRGGGCGGGGAAAAAAALVGGRSRNTSVAVRRPSGALPDGVSDEAREPLLEPQDSSKNPLAADASARPPPAPSALAPLPVLDGRTSPMTPLRSDDGYREARLDLQVASAALAGAETELRQLLSVPKGSRRRRKDSRAKQRSRDGPPGGSRDGPPGGSRDGGSAARRLSEPHPLLRRGATAVTAASPPPLQPSSQNSCPVLVRPAVLTPLPAPVAAVAMVQPPSLGP